MDGWDGCDRQGEGKEHERWRCHVQSGERSNVLRHF